MLKEAVVAWLKVPSWHLFGETKEIYEEPQSSRSSGRDLNREPSEYDHRLDDGGNKRFRNYIYFYDTTQRTVLASCNLHAKLRVRPLNATEFCPY
jgi:hypothetical protein